MDQRNKPAIVREQLSQTEVGAYMKNSRSKKWWVVSVAVLVILITATCSWFLLYSAMPRSDRYQAVFLDNGQVFFGRLKNVHGRYLTLQDAYYTKKPDLPEGATDEQKAAVEANVSLVKVGDEVYGPENVVQIRAEQVLFWQNLQSDSKVSKAIESAK